MNIDFHYGVVYMMARLGGLDVPSATTVAHACQYVDDATTGGLLFFKDGETFERFASAHEMVDYLNLNNEDNRAVWSPFHFLPGGEGTTIEQKAICRPNSAIAQDVVKRAIRARTQDNALHRLGVTLHVYVDTFAHQGFSGIMSDVNRVSDLTAVDNSHHDWQDRFRAKALHLFDNAAAFAVEGVLPLGHGAALHYPDMPWVTWQYTNGLGEPIVRNNLTIFLDAADMTLRAVRAYVAQTEDFTAQAGLSAQEREALSTLLSTIVDINPENRLAALSAQLSMNALPGLHEAIPRYIAKGEGSWKFLATGIDSNDDGAERPAWTPAFEESDYRKFHDAVKEHRFTVTQRVLPEHKVRLA